MPKKPGGKRIFGGEEYTLHSFNHEKKAQELKKSLQERGLSVRTRKDSKYGTRGVYYRTKNKKKK